jgi:hypothetical protein
MKTMTKSAPAVSNQITVTVKTELGQSWVYKEGKKDDAVGTLVDKAVKDLGIKLATGDIAQVVFEDKPDKPLGRDSTLGDAGVTDGATLILQVGPPHVPRSMVAKAILSVVLALAAMILVFFVYKDKLSFVKDVPDHLIYMSIIGVLIYIGGIAATKAQGGTYTPLPYIPEYMLRLAEAPVFMTVTYALILQQNAALNQPGTLLAVSLFVGMFTRDLEEFIKLIGTSILKPLEDYVSKIH